MTLEELRKEAKKLGYKLVKDTPKIEFVPCVCGANRRHRWVRAGGSMGFECQKCGRKSPFGKTEQEARLLWNQMIEELQNDNSQKTKKNEGKYDAE